MTTRIELLELINNGENSGVEFKRDDIDNRALAKELVAFSNLSGGAVLLGVEDGGTVSGITRDKLEEWVMTACRDKIRPAIIPFFEIIRDVEPGKHVAVVRVAPGFSVHSVWHNSGNTYYIRVGTQSREATPEELSRLFQQRGAFRAELRPISGAQLADLDLRRLRDYFGRVRQQATPEEGDEAGWRTLLLNTELMVEDGITLSGLLLFGTSPNRFLPFVGIDAVAFPGIEKDYAARERATLRGPMTPLLGEGGLVENGLVEQALDFPAVEHGQRLFGPVANQRFAKQRLQLVSDPAGHGNTKPLLPAMDDFRGQQRRPAAASPERLLEQVFRRAPAELERQRQGIDEFNKFGVEKGRTDFQRM